MPRAPCSRCRQTSSQWRWRHEADSEFQRPARCSPSWAAACSSIPRSRRSRRRTKCPKSIVTGLRASLESAQGIKQNSDTFVDSITATDIGAFPDKSVAEALQRVPGITVSRLQSSDDSNHFSAEPATVLIRGLTFVRTEFNGRDSFSADGYRGLNFNDVSPELMQGVDTYKNQTAEMIEGGIAGVVNLRTRTPFDSDGQTFALTGRVNYGTLSEEPTYEASGVYSNTWETDSGRFGLLANAAYSNIVTRTEAVNMTRIATFCSDYPQVGGAFPNANRRCRRQRGVQQQSVRRHGLALCARPGELLAGRLRPHAYRRGAHACSTRTTPRTCS